MLMLSPAFSLFATEGCDLCPARKSCPTLIYRTTKLTNDGKKISKFHFVIEGLHKIILGHFAKLLASEFFKFLQFFWDTQCLLSYHTFMN